MRIRRLESADVLALQEAVVGARLIRDLMLYEQYLREHTEKTRVVFVACSKDDRSVVYGHVTLKWVSEYSQFAQNDIPEISDLLVFPQYRGKGIGLQLLTRAEQEAATRSETVGLGVGLYVDYGRAQQLYVRYGYIPDGNGVTYDYAQVAPGATVRVDDELLLWLTKTLRT